MRIIFMDAKERRFSEPLIAHTAAVLGRYGIEVERIRSRQSPRRPYNSYAALIATRDYPRKLQELVTCYGAPDGGSLPSRPETLEWLREAGIPVMRWSRAQNHEDLDRLFDSWETDALLVKPSYTFGGSSVRMFTRGRAHTIRWNPQNDVFCPEINPEDGDIYKLEMFGSTFLLGWRSRVAPARIRMKDGLVSGIFGAYGSRELYDWPESLLEPARRFGAAALDRGFGHTSLDFMCRPDGAFEAIEVNLGDIGLWWTSGLRVFRDRYARGVHQMLIERHLAPKSPAAAPVRLRHWARRAVRRPKIFLREIQGARARRRLTRDSMQSMRTAPRSLNG